MRQEGRSAYDQRGIVTQSYRDGCLRPHQFARTIVGSANAGGARLDRKAGKLGHRSLAAAPVYHRALINPD
jgi:hypothetical protein